MYVGVVFYHRGREEREPFKAIEMSTPRAGQLVLRLFRQGFFPGVEVLSGSAVGISISTRTVPPEYSTWNTSMGRRKEEEVSVRDVRRLELGRPVHFDVVVHVRREGEQVGPDDGVEGPVVCCRGHDGSL